MRERASHGAAPPVGAALLAASGRRRLPDWVVAALLLLLVLAVCYPGPLLRGEIFASSDGRNSDAFTVVGDAALARGHYPQWNPYPFAGMPTFGSLAYTRGVYPPALLFSFLQEQLGMPPLTWMLAHLLFGGLGMHLLLARWGLPLPARLLGAVAFILSPNVLAWSVYGHGSKLMAAMYLPWIVTCALEVLGGGGRRWAAGLALLLGLQILRGHIQITYYTLLAVGLLALCQSLLPFLPAGASGTEGGAGPSGHGAEPSPSPPWRERWRRLALLAGGVSLAFLLGAVLLVPVQGYARLSIRGLAGSGGGADYSYATNWSLAPSELPTLILPAAAGFGRATYQGAMPFTDYPNYFGILLLLLAAAGAAGRRPRLALALGVLSLLSLLVAFGKHGSPLFDLLYRQLPFFNKFRVPAMILVLPAFAVAALAAVGATALVRREPARFSGGPQGRSAKGREGETRRSSWSPILNLMPFLIGGLGLLLLLLGASGLPESAYAGRLRGLAAAADRSAPRPDQLAAAWALHRADLLRIGLILLAAGGSLWLANRRPTFRARGALWSLALLVALDLGLVGRLILHPDRGLYDWEQDAAGGLALRPASPLLAPFRPAALEMGRDPAYAAAAANAGHDRVWPLGSLEGDAEFMVAGVRSLGGYHPAKLAAYEQVRRRLTDPQAPAGRLASWLAGRVVALPGELPAAALPLLRELGADLVTPPLHRDGMVLYENRAALPRARLLDAYALASGLPAAGDLGAFLDRLQSGEQPYGSTVVLDREPEPRPLRAATPAALPQPEFVSDGLDEVVLRTRAETPAILLLADMMVPGWSVQVDGRPAAALTGDLILRAVALPAGEHEVRWAYRDPYLRRGLLLTAVGVAGTAILCVPGGWLLRARRLARRRRSPPAAETP